MISAVTELIELAAFALAAVPLFLWLRRRRVPTSAGAAVMALGIFGMGALPALPGGTAAVPHLALALLALWALLACLFGHASMTGSDPRATPLPERLALGTWPAATATTAALVAAALPGLMPLALALGAVAAVLWLWFLTVAGDAAPSLVHTHGEPLDGTVLLVTVATEGVALVAAPVVAPPFPALAFALVELGAFLYVVLLALFLRSLLTTRAFHLAEDWRNGNCILHGAASITGLAALATGQVPAALCHALWIYCALAFVLVEAVELVRLARRVRQYGWLGGVLVYDASQWARNFTFGMFYAFTVAALQRGADAAWLAAPQRAVAAWGQYVVLALLLIEAALLAWGRRSERA